MRRAKMSKQEKKIHDLEKLVERRVREINRLNKLWAEDVARVERKNRFTKFQIDSIKKGEWPL